MRGASLFVVAMIGSACGSDDEGLFGDGDGGAGGQAAAAGTGQGGADASTSGGSGGLSGQAGADAGPDAAAAGMSGMSGAAGQAGAGGTAGDPGVGTGPCNGPLCDFAGGLSCCVGDGTGAECVPLSQLCVCTGILCNTTRIRCDGPEDCPGQLCCAELGFTSGDVERLICRNDCANDFVGTTRREVCHPGGQACQNGSKCEPFASLPPGYALCAPDP